MSVPYTFQNTPNGTKIPLSHLDANFTYLDNETTSIINNLPIKVINTIADLRAFPVNSNLNILVNGYYTDGDGGGGYFYPVTTGGPYTDNGGTIITTGLGITASSAWLRNYSGNVNVKWFGAKGDYNPNTSTGTDDAPAFNAAITYVNSIGGGTVYVPPVKYGYCLNEQVWVKSNVTLYGSQTLQVKSKFVSTLLGYYGGNCLVINWGAGTPGIPNTITSSAIRLSLNSNISGLNFIYPSQTTTIASSAPVVFPPAISCYDIDAGANVIENIWFVNPYIGIYLNTNHVYTQIQTIWGWAAYNFITLNGSGDASVIHDINTAAHYYLLGRPDANFTDIGNLYAWTNTNGIGIRLGRNDQLSITSIYIGNYKNAVQFGNCPIDSVVNSTSAQATYGSLIGGGIEGCVFPISVQGSNAYSNVTVTAASPAVITWANHGLQNGTGVYFQATTMPVGLTAGTTYYVVSATTNTFEVSSTYGGPSLGATSTGSAVICINLTAGGINNQGFFISDLNINPEAMFASPQSIAILNNQPVDSFNYSAGNLVFSNCGFWGTGTWGNPSSAVTITTGSPGIINWTNNGLSNGSIVYFTAATFPTGILPSTTYFIVNWTPNNFEVSLSYGGSPVSISTTGISVVCNNYQLGPINGLISTIGSNVTFNNCVINPCFSSYYVKDISGANTTKFYNCYFSKIDQTLTPINPITGLQTVRSANSSCYGRVIFLGNTFGDEPTFSLAGSSTYATGASPITAASANNLTLPDYGDYTQIYSITGTTNITNIYGPNGATILPSGRIITLIFTNVLTVIATGGNLKLNTSGNFVTAADYSLTLISNGTNWYEISRSVNS